MVTKLPFINLFNEICALIAPEYFEAGSKLMELVVKTIDKWPPPCPGQVIHLPLMNVLFQVSIELLFEKLKRKKCIAALIVIQTM